MSTSPALRASALSAYRDLLRAASCTFAGDDRLLNAFKLKMRTDAIEARSVTDPQIFEHKIQLAREMALVLRMNVVQGEKLSEEGGKDRWRLRLTKYTELGSNESVKSPTPMSAPTSACCAQAGGKSTQSSVVEIYDGKKASSTPRLHYSSLKRAHKNRQIPELKEEDLIESFVRGSGPGGQSANKTENNVQLIHKPTGVRVTCHVTRSLATNRKLARRNLLEKLDKLQNPGLSKSEMQDAKDRERERRRRRKARKKTLERQSKDQHSADPFSPP